MLYSIFPHPFNPFSNWSLWPWSDLLCAALGFSAPLQGVWGEKRGLQPLPHLGDRARVRSLPHGDRIASTRRKHRATLRNERGRDERCLKRFPAKERECLSGIYWETLHQEVSWGRREEVLTPFETCPGALRNNWGVSKGQSQGRMLRLAPGRLPGVWGPVGSKACVPEGLSSWPTSSILRGAGVRLRTVGRRVITTLCSLFDFGWVEGKAGDCQHLSHAGQALHGAAGRRFWSQAERGTGGLPKGNDREQVLVTGGRW